MSLAEGDVAGRVDAKSLAQSLSGRLGNGGVNIPESVFLHRCRVQQLQRSVGFTTDGENRLVVHALEYSSGGNKIPALGAGVLDLNTSRVVITASGKSQRSKHIFIESRVDALFLNSLLRGDLAENSDSLSGLGKNAQELLLDEGTIDSDIHNTDTDTILRERASDLGGQSSLDSAEGDQYRGGLRVTVVLKSTVVGSEFTVQGL